MHRFKARVYALGPSSIRSDVQEVYLTAKEPQKKEELLGLHEQ